MLQARSTRDSFLLAKLNTVLIGHLERTDTLAQLCMDLTDFAERFI